MKTKIAKVERVQVTPRLKKSLSKHGATRDKRRPRIGKESGPRKPISHAGELTAVLASFLTDRTASKEAAIARAAGEFLSAAAVGRLLRSGRTAIQKAKDEGRLLAYKEPGKRAFLFPVFQFDHSSVAPWVSELIGLVGNGFAALHFLTVERKSLKGASYLMRLHGSATPNERPARIQEMLVAAHRLAP